MVCFVLPPEGVCVFTVLFTETEQRHTHFNVLYSSIRLFGVRQVLRAHVLQQPSVKHSDFAVSHVLLHLHLAAVTPKPSLVLRGVEFLHLWTLEGSPRFFHLHPVQWWGNRWNRTLDQCKVISAGNKIRSEYFDFMVSGDRIPTFAQYKLVYRNLPPSVELIRKWQRFIQTDYRQPIYCTIWQYDDKLSFSEISWRFYFNFQADLTVKILYWIFTVEFFTSFKIVQ